MNPASAATLETIAVVGAGTRGHGIAQTAIASGFRVTLCDTQKEALERGVETIRAGLDHAAERGRLTAGDPKTVLALLETTLDLRRAAATADLVIEAVPERLDLKREVLAAVEAAARPGCLLASNTSSLRLTTLAEGRLRPERLLGMHFFNPVPVMALLEIVVHPKTAPETLAAARAVGERMGKTCIVVHDAPGFASSRLGLALGLEAIRMVEQGVASPQDIDTAMELGYRHPMGPLRLTDLIGLDVRLDIALALHRELLTETFRPPQLLVDMVRQGRLGKKSGRGFYEWT
jgi:3-hydroxybutyryl-CoA dehydrogenase